MKLKNKVALITGSSSGIGKSVALLFAKEGADVIICSHSSVEEGQKVLKEVKDLGSDACYISANLQEESDIDNLYKQIEKKYGKLDILVNNAGRTFNVPFKDISEESLVQDIKTNLISTILCSQKAIKLMQNQGWIVNTSSIRGLDYSGRSGVIGYCAAKSGINSYTKTLAMELAPKIFVNAVLPGFVHTNYMNNVSDELKNDWLSKIPIKRFIQPDELAQVYLLLATSTIFTGSLITPDGGYSLLGR